MTRDQNFVLASEAEREQAVQRLNTAFAEGRLDAQELDGRIGRALAARSRADLRSLVADLPVAETKRAPYRPTPRPLGDRLADVIACWFCCRHARTPIAAIALRAEDAEDTVPERGRGLVRGHPAGTHLLPGGVSEGDRGGGEPGR